MDPKDIFHLIEKKLIDFVDLKFADIRGVWQHMTVPVTKFTLKNIKNGFGFDGSSIRGFKNIEESDMILKPDLETAFLDPFFEKTLSVIADVYEAGNGFPFVKNPRLTAKKAEEYLKDTKIADVSFWGPEIEFFIFDKVNFYLSPYFSFFKLKSSEFTSEVDEEIDGYPIRIKQGYFPAPPYDKLQNFRNEMVKILNQIGIEVEIHHHEVSSGGQVEIDLRYDTLTKMADKVMIYKYVARNLAKKYGLVAVFLPKPVFGDNGSGMHTHQSLFKNNKNIFYDPRGYGQLSKEALFYLAGILYHIEPLLAFTNPTVNSYRRLVPHFEAPTALAFSKRNRSAAIRIPMYFNNNEKAKRLEFRCPDPTANPYLAFSAMLVFGVEGIKQKLDPKKLGFGPFDENIWEKENIKQTPDNLFLVLESLKKDKILIKSEVFSKELIESYYQLKKEEAIESLRYPTPADFFYYADI
ncbi:MAG: type I glutamate--ammonia ligase [Microgenomates group bacterium]